MKDQISIFSTFRGQIEQGSKPELLDYGLKMAKGESIAIFDADFVPDTQFYSKRWEAGSKGRIGSDSLDAFERV
ncbi:MAG: hypothetical protein R2769_08165 [Saprospiraceae bacterium]